VAKPVSVLCSCGRRYVPDCFNAHHQQGCSHPACRRERKRCRDRLRYRRKYREDGAFREAEKQRRSGCRRLAKARARLALGPAPLGTICTAHSSGSDLEPQITELRCTVTGMVAIMAGDLEGDSVGELLSRCTERGRRLRLSAGQSP
jgi:hypothetical protein